MDKPWPIPLALSVSKEILWPSAAAGCSKRTLPNSSAALPFRAPRRSNKNADITSRQRLNSKLLLGAQRSLELNSNRPAFATPAPKRRLRALSGQSLQLPSPLLTRAADSTA